MKPSDDIDPQSWIDAIKTQKTFFVEVTERGDMPPVVIVHRKDGGIFIVIPPKINKYQGLHAAHVCKVCCDPLSLTIMFDAHFTEIHFKAGQTKEEVLKEYREKFPPGSMQRMCDEEGACATGLITDCINAFRITDTNQIYTVNLPYDYHGKGTEFNWLDKEERFKDKVEVREIKDGEIEGIIIDSLKGSINEPLLQDNPIFKAISARFNFSEERKRFHMDKAIMMMLHMQNYLILDGFTSLHPEWSES